MPGDAPTSRPQDSPTGQVAFSGPTLAVGDAAGSTLALAPGEGEATGTPPTAAVTRGDLHALRRAVARSGKHERRTRKLEGAVESADDVTTKIEHAITVFKQVASGDLGVQALGEQADVLFGMLQRLNHAKRWQDAMRVARCLATLLALVGRWLELLRSLRIALHAAEQLGDPLGEAWALHELGTLNLLAGRHAEANRQLEQARAKRHGSRDITATNHNLEALCQTLRRSVPHGRIERTLSRLARRPALALLAATALLVAGGAVGAALASSNGAGPKAPLHPAAATFSFAPGTPHAGQSILFTATATDARDPAASYTWEWGDGDPASARIARHAYHLAGRYRVALIVRDARGRVIGRVVRSVLIQRPTNEAGPNAYFSFQPRSPTVGQPVSFDASSSYDPRAAIDGYEWSFGASQSTHGVTALHTFSQPGAYEVSLTVTDAEQRRATLAQSLVVSAAGGKQQSAVALRCPSSHSPLSEAIALSGTVTPARAGASVKVSYLGPSHEAITSAVKSGANGSYTTSFTPDETGAWSAQSTRAESNEYRASSSESCTFDVAANRIESQAPTKTRIECHPTALSLAEAVTVSGLIAPKRKGAIVELTYRHGSGEAITRPASSNAEGRYEESFKPEQEGAWSVHASQAGTREYRASTSQPCDFTVEKPPATSTQTAAPSTKTPTTTTIKSCPPEYELVGTPVPVSGSIEPTLSGRPVKLTYLYNSQEPPEPIKLMTTSKPEGIFEDSYTVKQAGSWSVQASQAETSEYKESTSKVCTFTVGEFHGE